MSRRVRFARTKSFLNARVKKAQADIRQFEAKRRELLGGLAVEVERQSTVLTSTLRAGLGSWCYTAPEQWKAALSDPSSTVRRGAIQRVPLPVNSELAPLLEAALADEDPIVRARADLALHDPNGAAAARAACRD